MPTKQAPVGAACPRGLRLVAKNRHTKTVRYARSRGLSAIKSGVTFPFMQSHLISKAPIISDFSASATARKAGTSYMVPSVSLASVGVSDAKSKSNQTMD
jgi:hypothetical protein